MAVEATDNQEIFHTSRPPAQSPDTCNPEETPPQGSAVDPQSTHELPDSLQRSSALPPTDGVDENSRLLLDGER